MGKKQFEDRLRIGPGISIHISTFLDNKNIDKTPRFVYNIHINTLEHTMNIKAIFFDLDGTLLPMDQEIFIKEYLGGLCRALAPRGYAPEAVGAALWKSTAAMMRNDGRATNEEVFWNSFSAILGDNIRGEKELLDEFYAGDFQKIKNSCGYTPESRKLIDRLKSSDLSIILATSANVKDYIIYVRNS